MCIWQNQLLQTLGILTTTELFTASYNVILCCSQFSEALHVSGLKSVFLLLHFFLSNFAFRLSKGSFIWVL